MGYLIISRVEPDGHRRYVAWMLDDQPIAEEMRRWLSVGQTMEVLDYVQEEPAIDKMLFGPSRVERVHRWEEHFRKAGDPCNLK